MVPKSAWGSAHLTLPHVETPPQDCKETHKDVLWGPTCHSKARRGRDGEWMKKTKDTGQEAVRIPLASGPPVPSLPLDRSVDSL